MKTTFGKIIYIILQCTWGILQTAVGAVIFLVLVRRRHFMYRGCIATEWKRPESASIGLFIFISESMQGRYRDEVIVHEYGHTFQSLMLGPLYPFVVSIPSALWCMLPVCIKRRQRKNISYYAFYTERWANRLGAKATGETLEIIGQ